MSGAFFDQNTSHQASSQPITCVVIQLSTLSDTLQSLMALRAAKQLYPSLEITLVCSSGAAPCAQRVPWIHRVVALSSEESHALETAVAPLLETEYHLALNWTYSEASSFLCGALRAKFKLGYTRRANMEIACCDGWSEYVQAIVQGSVRQNIHLTDIYTTQLLTALQIHYGDPDMSGHAPVTSKNFFSLSEGTDQLLEELGPAWRSGATKWIGIHLGAQKVARTWPLTSWVKTIRLILERRPECGILLLGSPLDTETELQVLSELKLNQCNLGQVMSLVGESRFDVWAAAIAKCQWVFSADSAALHLSSVLGTRTLEIAIGGARWIEAGPYGNGHYVITSANGCHGCDEQADNPSLHACRTEVTPESVYAAWSYASTEWAHRRQINVLEYFTKLGWNDQLDFVEILRSKIRGPNEGGGVFYEPLVRRRLKLETWNSMVMGHIARAWYCGWVPQIGSEISRESLHPSLIRSLRELQEGCDVLTKVCQEAQKTAADFNQKTAFLKSDRLMPLEQKQELQSIGKKLIELDELIHRVGKTHTTLQAFSNMSRVLMHNLKGDHLHELGLETADCYRQLSEGVLMLSDWIKHTLSSAKPVLLKSREAQT
jgi:ADP-heptose:LPS heptosyltransferase